MIDKLKNIITRYDELTIKLSQPDVVRNIEQFTQLSKEHSSLSGIVTKSKEYLSKIGQLKEDEEILKGNDYELKGLVQEEIKGLRLEISTLEPLSKNFTLLTFLLIKLTALIKISCPFTR